MNQGRSVRRRPQGSIVLPALCGTAEALLNLWRSLWGTAEALLNLSHTVASVSGNFLPRASDKRPRACPYKGCDKWVGSHPDAPLFTGPRGGQRRATVYRAWHKALAKVGLPDDVKPHDLRHLSNTLAAKTPGITVKDLMARFGHKSEEAAMRYLHATDDADAAMAGGIAAALRKAQETDEGDAPNADVG